MNKLLDRLINLGVHETDSPYLRKRIQFTNTLKLSVLGLFMVYFILSLASQSPFLEAICIALMLTAVGAIYLSCLRWYNIAFTLFLGGFNIAMVVCCNSLDDGSDFSIIYLSTLFLYGSIDGERRLRTLLINLAISIGSFASVFLLPPHLWWRITLSPGWISFYHIFNYSFTFSLSLFFTLSIARNQQRNARKLQLARQEAEEQKEAYLEEKNRAEAATQAKSQFLSQMSHELRTPLNGIIGSVHLLLDEEVHTMQKDHFKVLQYSSEHMLHLINDVLDFSKIEAGGMELSEASFNLNHALSKLKAIFEWQFKERNLNIYFDINEEVNRFFFGDETRLIQVLSNLLGNALKFTIKGSVIVKAQVVSRGSNGMQVTFSVEDTGIGISDAQLQKIFEAFRQAESATTRKYGGTGLGLSISKALVSLLGGELQVESTPGKGSRFYFTLRLPFSSETPNKQLHPGSLSRFGGLRVLLVDDSPVNRKITRSFLERWEIIVNEAGDGKEAIELFTAGQYDLLLLDLHMPVMDGYEAMAQIRKMGSEVPAFAFTAALLPDMKDQMLAQGFNGFLQKPFRPEELHSKISEVFKNVF